MPFGPTLSAKRPGKVAYAGAYIRHNRTWLNPEGIERLVRMLFLHALRTDQPIRAARSHDLGNPALRTG